MSTETNDGGPAFPVNSVKLIDIGAYTVLHPGMSLRDWFAGMAMQGMLAYGVATVYRERAAEEGIPFSRLLAEESYRHADAMLAAREKGQSDG